MWRRRLLSKDVGESPYNPMGMLEWKDPAEVMHRPAVVLFVTDDGQWHSINLDHYRGGSVVPGDGFTAILIVRWVGGDVDTYEFRNIDTAHSVLKGFS